MKKKVLLTYRTKTLKTKRYADMIAAELGISAVDFSDLDKSTIGEYDIVIYGAGVYAGKINGLEKAKELFKDVKHGRFIVFATGGTPSTDRKAIDALWNNNLRGIDLERIPHYYLPAGINYDRMSFGQKIMMKITASIMESQRNKDFTNSLKKSYDLVNIESAEPLIERIRAMAN